MSQSSEQSFDQSLSQQQYNSDGNSNIQSDNIDIMVEHPIKIEDKEQELHEVQGVTIYDPKTLQLQFQQSLPQIVQKPSNRKKHKGTNIPKFLLKVFFNNIPNFPDSKHIKRLEQFAKRPEKSKTRFHLVELFGTIVNDPKMDHENQLNRRVLKRLLNRNYDNILTNKHIRNKRLYLMFCKKMMLRLNKPQLIDRLQI